MSGTAAIREAQEAVQKLFHDFKEANDERLKKLAKGEEVSALAEKVDKINADIDKKLDEVYKRQDDFEEAHNRHRLFGSSEKLEERAKFASQFSLELTALQQKPVSIDAEGLERYRQGMFGPEGLIRRGQDGMNPEIRQEMSVGSDPDGGYWVPPDTGGRIVRRIFESSPIRSIAQVDTTSRDSYSGTADLDEAASGGWVAEREDRPETGTPQIHMWEIFVHEQYAEPKVTQKILDDAVVNVEDWLETKVADKFRREENKTFVSGDGVKKPRGFLTYPHGVPSATTWQVIEQIASGADGAFAATNPGDPLIDLVYALKNEYAGPDARFVMNRATLAEVRKLKDGQDNYLWTPDFERRRGGDLLGFPVTEAEDMPNIASNSLSIAFGNFRQGYQIVDRIGIRVLRDPYTKKGFVLIYSTKRVGGDVVNFEAIKLMKFAASV